MQIGLYGRVLLTRSKHKQDCQRLIRNTAQLKQYLQTEYGETLADQIMNHWHKPKMIEHDPSDALRDHDDKTLEGELEAELGADVGLTGPVNQATNQAENKVVKSDNDRASARHSDLDAKTAQLALQSLVNSKPPKV